MSKLKDAQIPLIKVTNYLRSQQVLCDYKITNFLSWLCIDSPNGHSWSVNFYHYPFPLWMEARANRDDWEGYEAETTMITSLWREAMKLVKQQGEENG
ncbi:hypothetical protein [Calothrix sp. 336/3]|uniref:hypothetical protein n=1 Tax=Calothrix sp. 336/3 TaxID=1337936 RepID=UPI0004E33972|nr:hypothetical protein [Calothrix sp. 336/3]AKG21791.1 hypothetical protein IJ00_11460 [Calothrix sp. 336/3]